MVDLVTPMSLEDLRAMRRDCLRRAVDRPGKREFYLGAARRIESRIESMSAASPRGPEGST